MDNSQNLPNQPPQSSQPATVQPTSIEKPIILLVEDDPLLNKMYQTKLENEGYTVLKAEDGETGLKMALEQKVDFIILDMMMPRLSGLEVLTRLRQYPKGKDLPVVVLTNLAERQKAEQALQLGAKEYLIKANLTPSEIVAKVKQYLGR